MVFSSKMYDPNSIWEFINKGGRGVEAIQAVKCNQLPIHRAIKSLKFCFIIHFIQQADLVDHDSFQTIILVISESFASHHSDKICVGKYIRIISFNCGAKSKYEYGDSPHIIKISSLNTEIMEIATFPIQIMFMHCDSIVKFVICKVQHVVACIDNVVIQVHGLVNQKYEPIIADETKLEDIITFSPWKK